LIRLVLQVSHIRDQRQTDGRTSFAAMHIAVCGCDDVICLVCMQKWLSTDWVTS